MIATRLAEVFADAAAVPLAEAAALEGRLEALVDEGRNAWPRVALPPERFVLHLARHARGAGAPAAYLGSVHAGDLYLACAVCQRDRAALACFEEQFMSRVPEYVLRIRIGRDAIDEVQQRLRERLLLVGPDGDGEPKLAEYSGKGALGGWLRVTAVRTALNHLRSARPEEAAREVLGEELSVAADPELAYVKEHAQSLLGDAFRRVLDALEPQERSILRLHYMEGLTMDQLARLYKTPRSTIARRVAEVRQQILGATEELLREEKRLSPSAVASVIRQARSRLEVTLSRLLEG